MTNIIVWDISAEINKDYTITQLRWSRSTLVLFLPRRICTVELDWSEELQSNRMTAICIIRYSDWIIYQCHFLIRYRFKYHARYFLSQINGLIIPTDFLCFLLTTKSQSVVSCKLLWDRNMDAKILDNITLQFSHMVGIRPCFVKVVIEWWRKSKLNRFHNFYKEMFIRVWC